MSKKLLVLMIAVVALFVMSAVLQSAPVQAQAAATPTLKAPSKPTPQPKAPPDAKPGTKDASTEGMVKEIATAYGFTQYAWEIFIEPATTTFEDILAYYDTQIGDWDPDGAAVADIKDGKVALFNESGTGSALLIVYVKSGDSVVVLTIGGTTTKVETTKRIDKAQKLDAKEYDEFDKVAKSVAEKVGFKEYIWEGFTLSVDVNWETVLAFYNGQVKEQGWSGEGKTSDLGNGAMFAVFGDPKSQSALLLIYAPNAPKNRNEVLAIFGK